MRNQHEGEADHLLNSICDRREVAGLAQTKDPSAGSAAS
jgi:hypothetical protein